MKQRYSKRRILQELLYRKTSCGMVYRGWPCKDCFNAMKLPGIDRDELHLMWQATLAIRGGYSKRDMLINLNDQAMTILIDKLINKLRR